MGKTADLAMIQKTNIDALHKEGKSQKVITERCGCLQSAEKQLLLRKTFYRALLLFKKGPNTKRERERNNRFKIQACGSY